MFFFAKLEIIHKNNKKKDARKKYEKIVVFEIFVLLLINKFFD